jgi:riboflavin synthase
VERRDDAVLIDIALPGSLMPLVVPVGSIAIDGVSLTVNAVLGETGVQVSLIEHTLRATTLGDLVPDRDVHVEVDIVGKYIQRIAAPYIERARA